jgi:hypothetical protein
MMKDTNYTSYPQGFRRLERDIIPFYLWPARKMLMHLLLVILADS